MYVRIVTYPIREGKDPREWMATNAERARTAPGVKDVHFIVDDQGTRRTHAGAVLFFETEEAIDEYRASDAYKAMVDDLLSEWVDPRGDIRQGHYEVVEP